MKINPPRLWSFSVNKVARLITRIAAGAFIAVLLAAWTVAPALSTLPEAPGAIQSSGARLLPEKGLPGAQADNSPSIQTTPSGVNLVPIARNFRIQTTFFSPTSHDVLDECVQPGAQRVLRFDFLVYNAGESDLVVGSPDERPHLFIWSSGHDHLHMRDFNAYQLYDRKGMMITGIRKQSFCLFDSLRISDWARSTGQFPLSDCNTSQGLSAGWADLYRGHITCQFVPISEVPEGNYALVATTNALGLIPEDNYQDNTTCIGLHIRGDAVSEIEFPFCRFLEMPAADRYLAPPAVVGDCSFRQALPCLR